LLGNVSLEQQWGQFMGREARKVEFFREIVPEIATGGQIL
jgi:hypothetical protein